MINFGKSGGSGSGGSGSDGGGSGSGCGWKIGASTSCLHRQFLCHVLKVLCFIKIALKLSYICEKKQNFQALGAPPPNPVPSAAGGFAPRSPMASGSRGLRPQTSTITPPHCEFLATLQSSSNFGKNIHFNFRRRPFLLLLIQFRRRNYVIFTKVLANAKCVWSRPPKRPPIQNFTI